jgi:hypothetical protein
MTIKTIDVGIQTANKTNEIGVQTDLVSHVLPQMSEEFEIFIQHANKNKQIPRLQENIDIVTLLPTVKQSKRRHDEEMLTKAKKQKVLPICLYDVENDNNCGFRIIAKARYNDETCWNQVKYNMLWEVKLNRYEKLGYNIENLLSNLESKESRFYIPDCAQVAADAYYRSIVIRGNIDHEFTYLPLEKKLLIYAHPIILYYKQNRFVMEEYTENVSLLSLADLNPQHFNICKRYNWSDGLGNALLHYPDPDNKK